MIDPNDEYPFVIIHPVTGDRAYALDRPSAEVARRTLNRDHGLQGRDKAFVVQLNPMPKPVFGLIEGGKR